MSSQHVCGTDDIVSTNEYDNRFAVSYEWVQTHSKPVVMVGGCSGTLLEYNIVITVAHCNIEVGDKVYFDYGVNNKEVTTVKKILENGWNNGTHTDYAIVEIDKPMFDNDRIQKIGCKSPEIVEDIYLIAHPERQRKKIAWGAVRSKTYWSIGYLADTKPGSSGAGMLNSDGEFVGVHSWGSCLEGDVYRGYNGGAHIERLLRISPKIRELASCD